MKNSDLRHLSRGELVELLIRQKKENAKLLKEIEELRKNNEDRELRTKDAGTLAEAALALNGVFEAADKAAKEYLNNINIMYANAREECDRMLSEAKAKASRIENGEEQL